MNSLHVNDLPREILWEIISQAGHDGNTCQRETCLVSSLSFRLVCHEWNQTTPFCLKDLQCQLLISPLFKLPKDLLEANEEEIGIGQLQKIDAFMQAALKTMVLPRWLEALFSRPILCKVQVLALERKIQDHKKQVAQQFEGPFEQRWFCCT